MTNVEEEEGAERDPLKDYLSYAVNQWLDADPNRTQDDLAELIGKALGKPINRTSVANIKSGRAQVSYQMRKAVAAALGMTMAQAEGKAEEWFAAREEERKRDAERAASSRVIKRPGKKTRPNLDTALGILKQRTGTIDPTLEDNLRHVGNVLPADLDLSTWLAIAEDCAA